MPSIARKQWGRLSRRKRSVDDRIELVHWMVVEHTNAKIAAYPPKLEIMAAQLARTRVQEQTTTTAQQIYSRFVEALYALGAR